MGLTIQLMKQSFGVVRRDKEMLLFPILSLVFLFLAFWFIALPGATGALDAVFTGTYGGYIAFGFWFMFYILMWFISIFFYAAIVGAALKRMDGQNPTFGDGFRYAGAHWKALLAWAFIAGTVGLLINILQNALRERGGLLGGMAGGVVSFTWTMMAYLVVPVIISEDRKARDSMGRSKELMQGYWSKGFFSGLGFGLLTFGLLFLGGLLIGALLSLGLAGEMALIIGAFYYLFIFALMVCVRAIFTAGLYRYATKGSVGLEGFDLGGMIERPNYVPPQPGSF